MPNIKLFSGSSHPGLVQLIADRLDIRLGRCRIDKFPNNELNVEIGETVSDEDVFILQTGCGNMNSNLMELLLMISACKLASARRITVVIPCFPYARSNRKEISNETVPIAAKLVANMLSDSGADRVITLDLHAPQIQGFFDIPVDNLSSEPAILEYIRRNILNLENCVLVAPHPDGAKRVTSFSTQLNVDIALLHQRLNKDCYEDDGEFILVGNLNGKVAIIIDDIADTFSTLQKAVKKLREEGAREVHYITTHGLFLSTAMTFKSETQFDSIVTTNTVPQVDDTDGSPLFHVIDMSSVLAEAIRRTHNGESVSYLFDHVPP